MRCKRRSREAAAGNTLACCPERHLTCCKQLSLHSQLFVSGKAILFYQRRSSGCLGTRAVEDLDFDSTDNAVVVRCELISSKDGHPRQE